MAEIRNTYAKGDRYYGNTASRYEKKRKKQDWWHVEQTEMESLLETLPDGLKVVDVPFGTGRFVPFYLAKGFKVSGLDASHEMLASAKDALGADYDSCTAITGSAMDLPYDDGQFDLMVSTRFLRDIILFGDAKKALSEFIRVSSGYLIIQLGEAITGGRIPDDTETWHSVMSPQMIEETLNAHGLEIVEKRLVKSNPDENSQIHHILCRKI